MEPLRVAVRRGAIVESVHRVHVRSTGGVAFGDDLTCVLRSAAKPIQAIPLAEAYDDLDDDELAIASASHRAEPAQLDAVRKLLARAGASEAALECGPQEGRPHGRLGHNCSGKHAGFLAACRANGWPSAGYRLPEHPLQRRIAELVGPGRSAVDGCGVPTFGIPLSAAAALLPRTPQPIADAIRARPELIGGLGGDDTDLMLARPGWLAKRGAEGVMCAVSPEGEGFALKVEDGAGRAVRPALGWLLGFDEFARVALYNSREEPVGEIAVEA